MLLVAKGWLAVVMDSCWSRTDATLQHSMCVAQVAPSGQLRPVRPHTASEFHGVYLPGRCLRRHVHRQFHGGLRCVHLLGNRALPKPYLGILGTCPSVIRVSCAFLISESCFNRQQSRRHACRRKVLMPGNLTILNYVQMGRLLSKHEGSRAATVSQHHSIEHMMANMMQFSDGLCL